MVTHSATRYATDERETPRENPALAAARDDKSLFLLMLYNKALRCMDEALDLIDADDMIGKGERLLQAQDIIMELSAALDKNVGAVAVNLERLYIYVYRLLIQGNVRLDRAAIIEARGIIGDLYQAWQQVIMEGDSETLPYPLRA
jgi:flagellar protein FliS